MSESEMLFSCPIFKITREEITLESGKKADRFIVRHPGAIVVVPRLAGDEFLLLRQYRHPLRESILEFPAGTLEKGEEITACANRELKEETGYGARKWTPLGRLYPCPGFCDEVQHLYLAEELYPESIKGDDDEEITVEKVSLRELKRLIKDRELKDAKSLAAFARLVVEGYV